MKNYLRLLVIPALFLSSVNLSFAAISDTFTATQTQPYTAEVKASATLEFTGGATDGTHIQIGDCIIDFDGNAVVDDNDCSNNSAVTSSFANASELNTFFDSLINVTDNHNGHGALSVVDVDGTHTQFITAGTETADTHLYISGANGNLSMSSRVAGVVKKPQVLIFTPANVSPEGGVRFRANLGGTYYATGTVVSSSIKNIVEALQPDMDGNTNFTCTEDDTKVECTATNDQTNSFSADTSDYLAPSVSGNIDLHVDENTTATAVTIPNEITITDADPVITYHMHSTYKDHASFDLDEHTGGLTFVNRPDYENPASEDNDNKYEIIVMVEDSSGNGHAVYVTIHLDDVDEAPIIGNANIGSRDENLAVGTVIFDVNDFYTHNDNDGDGDPITYAITGGNTGNVFAMDPNTGVITLAAPLDYETTTSYHLTYSGTSTTGVNPTSTGNGGFWMTVSDVNEAPVITSNGGGFSTALSVAENQTAITTMTATDVDAGDTITYAIFGGDDQAKFSVDANTGILTFNSTPDFENPTDADGNNVYEVQVKVTDGTLMDVQNIDVTVTNEIEGPSIEDYIVNNLSEDASVGAKIYDVNDKMTSNDKDRDGFDITYEIISGNDDGKFTINSTTGQISLAKTLNFQEKKSYDLEIRAKDSNNTTVVGHVFVNLVKLDIKKTPIFRLYNKRTGAQLYTRGEADRDKIRKKFSDFEFSDGTPAFYASLTEKPGLTPIYRLYSRKTGAQLYTRGEADRDKILKKWPDDFTFTDGVPAFYASLSDDGTTPIYRLYNKRTGMQLYTRGEADRDKILKKWPDDFTFTDGVPAFYASLTN